MWVHIFLPSFSPALRLLLPRAVGRLSFARFLFLSGLYLSLFTVQCGSFITAGAHTRRCVKDVAWATIVVGPIHSFFARKILCRLLTGGGGGSAAGRVSAIKINTWRIFHRWTIYGVPEAAAQICAGCGRMSAPWLITRIFSLLFALGSNRHTKKTHKCGSNVLIPPFIVCQPPLTFNVANSPHIHPQRQTESMHKIAASEAGKQ